MNSSPKSTDDLSQLVDQASGYVRTQKSKRHTTPSPRSRYFSLLLQATLLGALAWGVYALFDTLSPPAPAEVAQDLGTVIDQAQALVEQSRRDTGKLPDTLPSSAMASVVQYQREGNDYRLSAVVMGIRVTLEPNGQKTTQEGETP